jgi:hypothetical protein
MGHTTSDMLWRHYRRAVLRNDAEAFWKFEPPKGPENVVAMPSAA